MSSKDKNISQLLRKYGYAFPSTEEEVETYENKLNDTFSEPSEWPDLSDIIGGKINKVIELNNVENKSFSNLAMAAREGKEISEEDKARMKKDKEDARKK